jgi:adenosylhomocysteine nucleosidase
MPCYSLPSLGATAAVGGHGKTQFAVQCQYLIDRCDGLAALFCVGAAGSLSPDIHFGDVVVGECTIEHDYKIRFEPAEPPCHAANETLLNEFRRAAVGTLPFRTHFGPIASGDEDIVDEVRAWELQQFTGAKCVAWEGSGGARAAAFNGVPFLEIRSITDGADADAAASYRANCERVLPNIAELVVRWRP